jgi:hypothetical protein
MLYVTEAELVEIVPDPRANKYNRFCKDNYVHHAAWLQSEWGRRKFGSWLLDACDGGGIARQYP